MKYENKTYQDFQFAQFALFVHVPPTKKETSKREREIL
jgi:hypothetical protein